MASPTHSTHSSAADEFTSSSELSSLDRTPSSPCHCGDRWIVHIQANRIAELERLCQKLVRDKAQIHGRKERYKGNWRFLEDEIVRFIDERMAYQQMFDGRVALIRRQLQQMSDILHPSAGTQQPTPCCAIHTTQMGQCLERGSQLLEEWIEREELGRGTWQEMGDRVAVPRPENPANPGELTVDQP